MSTSTSEARAADSGSEATDRFRQSGKLGEGLQVPPERVSLLAGELIKAANDIAEKHQVTYEEYNVLKAWLIQVGEDGEWPLFLDVWLEHTIEDVNTRHREGSKGSIEGPYYVPDAPTMASPAALPMREDEDGTDLLYTGTVQDTDGAALSDAVVEVWHADSDGYYSQFAPDIPEWNLRGKVTVDSQGKYEIRTKRPAPYQIPTDGACGKLIAAADWHAWRPAHLHIKISAPGHQLVTQQLYFPGDPHNSDDIASAVKPELMLDPQPHPEGGQVVEYDYVLDKD